MMAEVEYQSITAQTESARKGDMPLNTFSANSHQLSIGNAKMSTGVKYSAGVIYPIGSKQTIQLSDELRQLVERAIAEARPARWERKHGHEINDPDAAAHGWEYIGDPSSDDAGQQDMYSRLIEHGIVSNVEFTRADVVTG